MHEEIESMNKNSTWTLTTLPPDRKAIGYKRVYKIKRNSDRNFSSLTEKQNRTARKVLDVRK